MQRITNNISANLTSTQATEKAMYNMGKLGFILSPVGGIKIAHI